MKRGELHHDEHVSFLTDCVVMTPKQQRVILVGGDRASGHEISCKTCKEMHNGTQESYMRRDESLCTSLVLKRLSHNSKSQQKEARTGSYTEKQASDFAKYPIMGQPLKCGVW